VYEDATLRYLVIERRVERGKASWSALTKDEQRELYTAVDGWRAAAAQGYAPAAAHLGFMLAKGRGMA
jgi:TPR repeat protein